MQSFMQMPPPTYLHAGRCPLVWQTHTFHGVETTACAMWSSCQSGIGVKSFAHAKLPSLSCPVALCSAAVRWGELGKHIQVPMGTDGEVLK